METITLALYMVLPRQIDIAQLLFNSVGTIKSYLYRIYIKLEATKRSDAINKAIKLGIIQRI
jgi:DNA-binding NarL/FixJ family response regulator